MMELLRHRVFKGVILIGMAVVFAIGFGAVFTGVGGSDLFGRADWALKINGKKVDVHAYQDALRRQADRAKEFARYGQEDYDVENGAQEALIQRELLLEAAQKSGIVPKDLDDLRRALSQNTDLSDIYRAYAASFSPAQAMQAFSQDQAIQGIYGAIQKLPTVTDAEVEADFIERNTKAKVRVLEFPYAPYENFAKVSDADAKAYYEANKSQFWRGVSADVEFVRIEPNWARTLVKVAPEETQNYYKEHQSDYKLDEVRARHILKKFPDGVTPQQKEAIHQEMDKILAEAKKPGADFAELAKKYSEDGSAPMGGDLGFFGRGAMVKPFEDAAYALSKKGDLSDIVESQFGYHIIQFEEKREGVKPLEQVRPEIENTLFTDKALEKAREDAEELFFQIDAEGPEKALKDPKYKVYGLSLQTTGFFGRDDASIPNVGSSWQFADFVKEAYSARVGQWQEPLEVKQSYDNKVMGYFVLRVKERKPAGIAEFARMKDDITTLLKKRKAKEMAQTAAKRLWDAKSAMDNLDALLAKYKPTDADKKDIVVRESGEFATATSGYIASIGSCRPAMVAAFQMNPTEVRGPFEGQTAAYIIELAERKDPNMADFTDAEKKNIRQRLLSVKSQNAFQSWYQSVRDKAKVERNEKVLARF